MSLSGLLAQVLNGVQYGLLLYLIASGLTLVFGVLGILGLVICQPVGIAAWLMGSNDLKEMDSGAMDPEGRA